MAKISFEDNNDRYVKCYTERDYSYLTDIIRRDKQDLSYYLEEDGVLYGYKITKNMPVSCLYKDNFYSVRFYFVNIDTLHSGKQEKNIIRIMKHLNQEMVQNNGYYNLRIPTHIVDLVRAYNQVISTSIFCGGTVEEYIFNKAVPDNNKNHLKIFMADNAYINCHKDRLLEMTYQSFETYQGQYHISNITDYQAGKIYENWIELSLGSDSHDLVVMAEHEREPIGFVTLGEKEHSVEGVLSAVSQQQRQYGAYKAMIAYAINYAYGKKKCFVTSTQFDNFIVQGTWSSLGLKPFYSIYNFHVDRRKK